MAVTKISDLINPEVMADMISAKVDKAIVVTPFAKIDNTLEGKAGDTITIPAYSFIGEAVDVAEGASCTATAMATTSKQAKVKKAMKAVDLTDVAVLSGYGNPVGEATTQLAKAIASKVDADAIDALYTAQVQHTESSDKIKYSVVVDAVDKFNEEFNSEKVMFVHPAQVTTLRKDSDFISADKYKEGVILTGEIGMIANCRIVASKRVKKFDTFYNFCESTTSGKKTVVASGASTGEVNLEDVLPSLPTAKAGDYVLAVSTASYFNPIVKLTNDAESEDDSPAITIFKKRDVNLETERDTLARKTVASVDEMYTVALTNDAKVVLAKIKA